MKNINYKVNRNQLYVGTVKTAFGIYGARDLVDVAKDKFSDNYKKHIIEYRNILFVPTESDKYANDLLYDSPNYPVLNMTDDRLLFSDIGKTTFVDNILFLSELLEYFGYPEELGYEDVLRIKDEMFGLNFIDDNCEVFGFNGKNELPNHDLSSDYIKPLSEHISVYRPIHMFGMLLVKGLPVDSYKPSKEERFVRSLRK